MANRNEVVAGLLAIATVAGGAAAGLSPATEAALRSSSYIYVSTERKSGVWSKQSPIWFIYEDGKIFFTTSPDSWKAKRIARGSRLRIRVGSEDGPELIGKPEAVTDAALIDRMGKAYSDKYWIAWAGFFRPRSDRVAAGKTKAYQITLTEK